jgi:hypothetical protein
MGVPDTSRQCSKATDQLAQGVAHQPDPLAGQPHLVASRGLPSQ